MIKSMKKEESTLDLVAKIEEMHLNPVWVKSILITTRDSIPGVDGLFIIDKLLYDEDVPLNVIVAFTDVVHKLKGIKKLRIFDDQISVLEIQIKNVCKNYKIKII